MQSKSTIPPKASRGLSKAEQRELRNGLLFISPWIIGFSVFLAWPIAMSIYYSLCDFSVLQPPRFIGLANYVNLFHDDVFLQALSNTFIYAAGAIPLGIVVALSIAMLLNTSVAGMSVYRTIFYLPSMVPSVATAVLWLWLFNGQYGIINFGLAQIPLGGLLMGITLTSPLWLGGLFRSLAGPTAGSARARWVSGIVAGVILIVFAAVTHSFERMHELKVSPPSWLADAMWVKPAFVIMSLWGVGNAMVIYLAGLQDVPQHLYEAADLDGANWWQKAQYVTIPTISPVILFNGIMAIIGTFNYFSVPYIMAPNGQPARSAYFIAVDLYDNAFQYLRMGYAASMAWVLFAIVFALTMLALKLSDRHVHYGES